MLEDFIAHRNFVLKRLNQETEVYKRTGAPVDSWTAAISKAYADVDLTSVDSVLGCLLRDFQKARVRLQRGKSAATKNDALFELDEIALAVRLLTQDIYYSDEEEK